MPKISVGSLSLYYEQTGAGAPLILIPGLGADHSAWGSILPALTTCFRCIAVDNRDCGQSDEASGGYGTSDMAVDIAGLMDALRLQQAHVAGWSMGGAIAQELALGWPQRVSRLALVASYDEGDPRASERHMMLAQVRQELGFEAYLKLAYPWSFTVASYRRPGFVQSLRERALEYPYKPSQAAFERQTDATLRHATRGRLKAIQSPTLVLVGAEDILTPPDRFSATMAQQIPHARLQIIAEAGHALMAEQPQAVAEALLAFFAE